MPDKKRIPLHEAVALAGELVAMLGGACERLAVAGSIRRRRATVGDIELCAIARHTPVLDMFGLPTVETVSQLAAVTDDMLAAGTLAHRLDVNGRKSWGQHYRRCTYRGFGLDLFIAPSAEQFPGMLTIRTGSAMFSHRLVTPTTMRLPGGLHGLMPPWAEFKGWRVRHRATGEPLDTPTEESVFAALGLPWVAPWDRLDDWQPSRVGAAAR